MKFTLKEAPEVLIRSAPFREITSLGLTQSSSTKLLSSAGKYGSFTTALDDAGAWEIVPRLAVPRRIFGCTAEAVDVGERGVLATTLSKSMMETKRWKKDFIWCAGVESSRTRLE
eukprot:CAMPEP_0184713600 /NCGR_PEP_ID=MMETSP0314-20130426/3920_1 /TAXON_ID=38298 /ORGANISM="Rhodella maculata, Strain CCMP 736" /LENGTH=114 /DNA_ID=CAMNT_0027176295 /DNA_START=259 /DNA_END=602 /DNA_ORIENTATION=-